MAVVAAQIAAIGTLRASSRWKKVRERSWNWHVLPTVAARKNENRHHVGIDLGHGPGWQNAKSAHRAHRFKLEGDALYLKASVPPQLSDRVGRLPVRKPWDQEEVNGFGGRHSANLPEEGGEGCLTQVR